MKRSILYVLLVFSCILLFICCGKDKVYQERITFENNTWNRLEGNKTITFKDIEISDTSCLYDFYVTIRHTPYINEGRVKFLMKIIYPSGIVRESIYNVGLKSADNTKWSGDAMGDLIDVEQRCRAFVSLPEKGNYTITLTNLGTYAKTVGIMDIGVLIKKSNMKEYKN
ncbi:MAG: hypothetical protein Q4Q06_04245 [Bacteroidota bacterium]|nr:hypothetical protein [Bacteroidota bacterium]